MKGFMKSKCKDRYPAYIPLYYLAFLLIRKVIRQTQVRIAEKQARRNGPQGIAEDVNGTWHDVAQGVLQNPLDAINKPAFWIEEDMQLPHLRGLQEKINALKKDMDQKGLRYCSPAGTFIPDTYVHRTEKKKNWENVWVLYHSGVKPKESVLDLGGASTIFSFYLAHIGCAVRVIDNDWGNCGILYNANYVARKMNWDLKAIDRDLIKPLPFEDNSFDRVFSVCVLEHLPSSLRQFVMREINRVLKPQGTVGLSVDYDHRREMLTSDRGLRFAYRQKIEDDIIKPSGLTLMGNQTFVDAYPDENFLGALFLKKTVD